MYNSKQKIIISDFDGTLTKRDTLIEFIRYTQGTIKLFVGLMVFSPLLVMMKLHLTNNGKTKQRLFAFFFKGMPLNQFNLLCDRFGRKNRDLLRDEGQKVMSDAILQEIPVFVVSASIDNWVIPFFYTSNDDYINREVHPIEIVGTEIETKEGFLTGRFLTPNCYGKEKVKRMKEVAPNIENNRDAYYIIAYGDSRGDKELLDFADERHFKPFREV